jgi:restriction system protein
VLWLLAGAVSVWPFPLVPSFRPWFVIGTIAVVGVWWWAICVIRRSHAAGKRLDELKAMTPVEFEEWVGARFKDLGYKVKSTALSGDHGVDLVATRDGEKVVIQCKRYRDSAVGEPVMRDLYGTMQHESADRAYLVTTSSLTPAARTWSRGKPIEIWDGRYLSSMSTSSAVVPSPTAKQADRGHGLSPRCPRCESVLIEKRNRRTGEAFLGCPNYPECKYTRSLPVAAS